MNKSVEDLMNELDDFDGSGFVESGAMRMAEIAEIPNVGVNRPLTAKQSKFIEGCIQGKTQRQAYRDAFDNFTGSDASITASACRLMSNPRIKQAVQDGWGETVEHLSEDRQAVNRYVLKGLIALSKSAKQEGTQLKALEMMGKASGMFTQQPESDKVIVTAEQLKRELALHMRQLEGRVSDVEPKHRSSEPERLNAVRDGA
jgi:phage terminase small subunit